jgi:hypothetical protein
MLANVGQIGFGFGGGCLRPMVSRSQPARGIGSSTYTRSNDGERVAAKKSANLKPSGLKRCAGYQFARALAH